MKISSHEELEVYKNAFKLSMEIFEQTKKFPKKETYSLVDQICRSSRSVCANIAEGFRRRLYPKSFFVKIIYAEGEVAETQVWLKFSMKCKYLDPDIGEKLYSEYDILLRKLVTLRNNLDKWSFKTKY